MMNTQNNARGFTLIEVMIVVVIVAILAAIAFPSYQENVRRGRRADAQSVLLQAAQWMERYYSQNNRYTTAANGTTNTAFANSGLTTSGNAGATYYNIDLATVEDNTFTLTATRTEGGVQANDACGDFSITNTGAKTVARNTKNLAECWGR
jgi:type IV pilus assembly protein PilE